MDALVAPEVRRQRKLETTRLWKLRNQGRVKEYQRKWRAENRESFRRSVRRWQLRNPHKCKAYQRKYKSLPRVREALKVKARQFRLANLERCRAMNTRYNKTHKEERQVYANRYYWGESLEDRGLLKELRKEIKDESGD